MEKPQVKHFWMLRSKWFDTIAMGKRVEHHRKEKDDAYIGVGENINKLLKEVKENLGIVEEQYYRVEMAKKLQLFFDYSIDILKQCIQRIIREESVSLAFLKIFVLLSIESNDTKIRASLKKIRELEVKRTVPDIVEYVIKEYPEDSLERKYFEKMAKTEKKYVLTVSTSRGSTMRNLFPFALDKKHKGIGRLLGHLACRGSKEYTFFTRNPKKRVVYVNAINGSFPILAKLKTEYVEEKKYFKVYIPKIVIKVLKDCFGWMLKQLPEEVYVADEEVRKKCLRAMIMYSGCIDKNGFFIFTSNNRNRIIWMKKLLDGVGFDSAQVEKLIELRYLLKDDFSEKLLDCWEKYSQTMESLNIYVEDIDEIKFMIGRGLSKSELLDLVTNLYEILGVYLLFHIFWDHEKAMPKSFNIIINGESKKVGVHDLLKVIKESGWELKQKPQIIKTLYKLGHAALHWLETNRVKERACIIKKLKRALELEVFGDLLDKSKWPDYIKDTKYKPIYKSYSRDGKEIILEIGCDWPEKQRRLKLRIGLKGEKL